MKARVELLSLLAIASMACLDYRLWGSKDDTPGGDSAPHSGDSREPGHTDSPVDETAVDCEDTGLHLDEPLWNFGEALEDTSGRPPTCTALGEVDWNWTVEWTFPYESAVQNVVVAPQDGETHASVFLEQMGALVVLDGRDGAVLLETRFSAYKYEEYSTPAIGEADGSPGLELASTSYTGVHVVDVSTGSSTYFPMISSYHKDEVVAFADVDGDGEQELAIPGAVYELDGTPISAPTEGLESAGFFVADLAGDGAPELVNTAGIWSALDGSGVGWPLSINPGYSFHGGPVEIEGAVHVLFNNSSDSVHLGRADGSVVWSNPDMAASFVSSVGDATGDGVPDICGINLQGELVLVSADGTTHWTWEGGPAFMSGGCPMADLDADGVYEIIVGYGDGLYLLDGATMEVLASEPGYTSTAHESAPVIADVDGDGSAEILVLVNDTLVVLGAASGRWARTRPVWHQKAYDITSIRDDGTLVSNPLPSWTSYNAFRAQPAHDGAHPDLHLEVEASASEWCDHEYTTLDVVVVNRGSEEAPAGTAMTVSGLVEGGWSPVDTVEIGEGIPAGYAISGSVRIPTEALGTRWIVDLGTEDDCDLVNNRAEGAVPSP
jgi:hypothetical protein